MTSATETPASAPTAQLPSLLSVSLARARIELLTFFRGRESVVFVLAFPAMLLVIFGSVFGSSKLAFGVNFAQYFVAGMIAAGLLTASFQNLAIQIPIERDSGALKRLAGTPMPRAAYFAGKILLVGFVSIVQIVLLAGIGALFYNVQLPDTAGRWFTFAWLVVLGTSACTLLGLAFSGFLRNGSSAPAVVSPIAIVLQFISGVFFVFSDLPGWMQGVASVFPLKWMTQGMRSVFLPDAFVNQEPSHSWQHAETALVLGGWCVVGLFLALRTFRWTNRESG
ncbi:MAG TPA: ABC transporter permease [Mycobacteriales bacterium]|nr:ABC transporter permease [Mycobacteriales bacterium]